jgi:hypothetical protein
VTELTDAQRVERARRAQMALEEFLTPAFAVVEREYAERMIEVAASSDPRAPEVIARLANGIKVARSVKAQIEVLVADGEVATGNIQRAERKGEMSPAKLRLLNIGPN